MTDSLKLLAPHKKALQHICDSLCNTGVTLEQAKQLIIGIVEDLSAPPKEEPQGEWEGKVITVDFEEGKRV